MQANGRVQRWLLFLPAAAVLATAFVRCTRAWDDFQGYIEVGQTFLHGAYSQGSRNTWPPFFSLLAIPIAQLARLPPVLARLFWAWFTTAVFAGAIIGWWRKVRPEGTPGWVAPLAALLIAPFWLHHIVSHQIYGLVFAAAAWGFWEASRGRDARAGIWIGLAGSAKVTPALTLIYFALRRRWRLVGWAVATAIACSLSVVPFLGLRGAIDAHLRWLQVISDLGGPHDLLNQSMPALFDRFITGAAYAAHVGVRPLLTLDEGLAEHLARGLSYAFMIAVGYATARNEPDPLRAFAPLISAAVVVAPYCWRNQYIAFFPLVLLALSQLARREADAWDWALVMPFLLFAVEREPGIVGWRIYDLFEGAGMTTITCLLLLIRSMRGPRRAAITASSAAALPPAAPP